MGKRTPPKLTGKCEAIRVCRCWGARMSAKLWEQWGILRKMVEVVENLWNWAHLALPILAWERNNGMRLWPLLSCRAALATRASREENLMSASFTLLSEFLAEQQSDSYLGQNSELNLSERTRNSWIRE